VKKPEKISIDMTNSTVMNMQMSYNDAICRYESYHNQEIKKKDKEILELKVIQDRYTNVIGILGLTSDTELIELLEYKEKAEKLTKEILELKNNMVKDLEKVWNFPLPETSQGALKYYENNIKRLINKHKV